MNENEKTKEYIPEILEYDPDIDGDDEHLIRDAYLEKKDDLLEKIKKAKEKNRGERKVRR